MIHLMNTYKRDLYLEKGNGSYVYDIDGKKYLDLVGGIATCSVGHSNPEIGNVINKQSNKLITASNLFCSKSQELLAKKLSKLSGLSKCFFSNSGAEAVEAAIKLVRKHSKKNKIIAMKNGFHGRTFGSLSATWNPKYKKDFEPLLSEFVHVDFNNIKALEKKICNNTAAVIIESIQGEAGIIIPSKGYLKEVEKLCKKNNVLLIIDEIQTGNGRTGKYFCYQHENVKPDIVTLAKGLANGLPIGVTISDLDFEPGDHGSTFGGNDFCCNVALKTIEIIEELLPEVEEKGDYFTSRLREIKSSKIKKIRGKGLMIAVDFFEEVEPIVKKCLESGMLINKVQNKVIRFLPPLTITIEEIDIGIEILKGVIKYD